MENFLEKQLEERPVTTLVLLIVAVVGVALGLGVITWIANWTHKGKIWAQSKIGTAPATGAAAPVPSK